MGPMQQSSLGLILPLHYVSKPYASTFLSKIKKNHHNSKSTCHTKFSHIVHCDWHSQKPICADFQAFLYTFSLYKLTFFHFFIWWSEANSQKFHILLILTGKNALKWLEWCVFRVWGMPNPVVQVLSLYSKWFLKNQNLRQKFHILLILTGKNALKWPEWHVFRVWDAKSSGTAFESLQ